MLRMYYRCIVLVVFALFLIGCPGESIVDPPPGTNDCANGAATGVDTADPGSSTTIIGPAGGTVTSIDGRVILTIPSGALSGNSEFLLHSITNKAPLAVGRAIVIGTYPNVTLNIPVSLTFKYSEADVEGTVATAIGIAYRDTDFVSVAVGVTRNPTDSTISTSITHLNKASLWAMYTAFAMRSDDSPVVDLGGTYTASMYTQPKIAQLDTLKPGGLVRLCAAVKSTTSVDARIEIAASGGGGGGAGPGSSSQSGGSATYTAPPTSPGNSSLAMLIRWQSGYHWGTVEVYNFLWIGCAIEFYLDGKFHSLKVVPYVHSDLATGETSVSGVSDPGVQPLRFIGLSFKLVDVGTYRMRNTGNPETDDSFGAEIGDKHYYSYYYECIGNKFELRWTDLGTVTVDVANRERGYISGRFSGRIAALDGTKFMCPPFEEPRWEVYPINGTFHCSWAIF